MFGRTPPVEPQPKPRSLAKQKHLNLKMPRRIASVPNKLRTTEASLAQHNIYWHYHGQTAELMRHTKDDSDWPQLVGGR